MDFACDSDSVWNRNEAITGASKSQNIFSFFGKMTFEQMLLDKCTLEYKTVRR